MTLEDARIAASVELVEGVEPLRCLPLFSLNLLCLPHLMHTFFELTASEQTLGVLLKLLPVFVGFAPTSVKVPLLLLLLLLGGRTTFVGILIFVT